MYRKILLTAALTAAFAATSFAATAPSGKWYVELGTDGKCTADQSATAPTNIAKGSATKGYSNEGAAKTELAKLQKTKPPVCAS